MNGTPDMPPEQKPHLRTAEGVVFFLKPGEMIVGRAGSCDISIEYSSVSKRHSSICWSEGGVSVTDLGSTNHTFVNHVCLREGQSGQLLHGNRLILGRAALTFLFPEDPTSEANRSDAIPGVLPSGYSSDSTVISFDLDSSIGTSDKQSFSKVAFRELRKANERLSVFYDFGRNVGNILDIDQLLKSVAQRIMKLVPADSGVIVLRRGDGYEPHLCWSERSFEDLSHARYSRTAVLKAIEEKRGLHIRDIPSQQELSDAQSIRQFEIKSTMIVPISLKNEVFGALCLSDHRHREDFGPDDFAMISGVAGQIAVAIKNAHLADEIRRTTAEGERIHRELEIAAHVQKSILPSGSPSFAGLDIGGASVPAREVGGDFFDYAKLGDDSFGMTIADVSGKGLAAALLTLQSKNVIHAFARQGSDAAEVLRKTNTVVYEDYARADMFLSVFYAILDIRSRVLRYASAGHNPPLLLRADGTSCCLESTGNLLGIGPDLCIKEEAIDLGPADILVLYTDGVSEARDPTGAPFGCEGLAERVREYRNLSAHEIADRVVQEVTRGAGPGQFDDATLVVVKMQLDA